MFVSLLRRRMLELTGACVSCVDSKPRVPPRPPRMLHKFFSRLYGLPERVEVQLLLGVTRQNRLMLHPTHCKIGLAIKTCIRCPQKSQKPWNLTKNTSFNGLSRMNAGVNAWFALLETSKVLPPPQPPLGHRAVAACGERCSCKWYRRVWSCALAGAKLWEDE